MSGTPKQPVYHTRRLARLLKKLRLTAGLQQHEVERRMDLCHGKLSRIELGQLPGRFELEAFLDRYGVLVSDWEPYVGIWRLARQKYWWSGLGLDSTFLSMEHEACLIRDYQTTRIPVLLQTGQHARKLLPTTLSSHAAERARKDASCLQQRQAHLDADDAPTAHFLLYQPVLHAGVDQKQLKNLLQRGHQDNITIQIVPRQDKPTSVTASSFTLLSYPESTRNQVSPTSNTCLAAPKPRIPRSSPLPREPSTNSPSSPGVQPNHAPTSRNSSVDPTSTPTPVNRLRCRERGTVLDTVDTRSRQVARCIPEPAQS
jgi:transcriptional regulator with XRE-family HTH domain